MYYYDYREYLNAIISQLETLNSYSSVFVVGFVLCFSVLAGMLTFELIKFIRGLKNIYDKRHR